jgi:hypothetical protein
MRDDDPSIRFLLAGGRLSGADHDRIIERVRRGAGTAGSAAAAALALAIGFPHRAGEGDGLTAKGGAPAGPVLEARCLDRASGTCQIGDRLVFEVSGAAEGGMLAAYAVAPSGERIWYFPTKDGHLPSVPAASGRSVVPEAARIGSEHLPGRYTVHLSLLGGPVDPTTLRAALLDGGVHPLGEAAIAIEVQP